MAADTFTWLPSYGVSNDPQVNLITNKFGDGYAQRVPNGVNYIAGKWTLPFNNKSIAEGQAILSFLRAHAGGVWFWFSDPLSGQMVKVVCSKFPQTASAPGTVSITATFEQVFDPGV